MANFKAEDASGSPTCINMRMSAQASAVLDAVSDKADPSSVEETLMATTWAENRRRRLQRTLCCTSF